MYHTNLSKLFSSSHYFGEGNGNPLKYSCLENPRDRGAWWAVYGITDSGTWLKRLSSSSHYLFWEENNEKVFLLTLVQFTSLTWKYIPTTQLSFSILHSWGKKKFSFFPLNCPWTWYWLDRCNYGSQPIWNRRSLLWKKMILWFHHCGNT